jgi:hypothetical protein
MVQKLGVPFLKTQPGFGTLSRNGLPIGETTLTNTRSRKKWHTQHDRLNAGFFCLAFLSNRSDECAGAMMRRKKTTMSTEITTSESAQPKRKAKALGPSPPKAVYRLPRLKATSRIPA